jgi:hypothetical protein
VLWDTVCSHELCTPLFAEELIRKGARWRHCSSLQLSRDNAEYVRSAAPPSKQICADILLVHQGRVFEQHDVWFYVYDGSLPDVMLSEGFCNDIPCISHPGIKLLDTREQPGDIKLLWQCMTDYKGLIARRFTHPKPTTSRLHFASINAALANVGGTKAVAQEEPTAPAATDDPTKPKKVYKRGAKVKTAEDEQKDQEEAAEKKRKLLQDVMEQRERLRARLGKPVSDEALQSATSILDRYPENFRPPGCSDACDLAVFTIKLKDQSKYHVALPRRTNPIVLQDMRRQIEELLLAGAIERYHSQPSSARFQLRSKNICVDMRNLTKFVELPDSLRQLSRIKARKVR